ncbi:hypothetical protein [Streptomyces sp. NPDC006510]|uniref:WD40 repeat domain-containing protein n=1 Tax=Streptomyces sp. NPDC006510 TaxID=3155600 RepID=UPI0033B7FEDB
MLWATGWTKGSTVGAPVAGHSAAVEEIATVAAGEREFVVTSGADDAVRVWDAASGEQIGGPVTGHECCASVAAIHLDGMGDTGTRTLLILGEWDNGLAVFDLLTGRKMAEGATTGALALAGLVVGGRPLVFTGGGEGYGLARVWDLAADTWSGELRPGHLEAVVAVAAVQDGPRLVGVTGSEDSTACVWDLSTGTRIGAPFTGHNGSVRAVAATAVDGRLLAVTGSNDQTARLWDATTAEQISVLLTGHGTVTCVASAVIDHRALAAIGTRHGTVRVWDLGADTQVGTDLLFPMPVDAVGITPAGRIAVAFGHEVAVFTAH